MYRDRFVTETAMFRTETVRYVWVVFTVSEPAFVTVPFDADYLSVLPLCVETPDVSCPTVCALFVPVPHAPYA